MYFFVLSDDISYFLTSSVQFRATNEVVFLLVAYKTAKKHFSVKIYVKIRTNVLGRNACDMV